MTLDARARATANTLLDKFGKSITLTSIVEGSYDPATGDMSANTTTNTTHTAIIKDYNGIDFMGGVIQSGDRKVMIAALDTTTPQPADKVTINSEVYQVIAVRYVWSGELPALYELQVRK
jgi:hypothetical protein